MEAVQNKIEAEPLPPPKPLTIFDNQDILLQDFIDRINENNGSLGITLSLNGLLYTGHLISGKEYFESLAKAFKESNITPVPEGEVSMFSFYLDSYSKPSEDFSELKHFHLRVSSIYGAGIGPLTFKNNETLPMRGKIADVNGFIIGELFRDEDKNKY